jgi:hypothetical protein
MRSDTIINLRSSENSPPELMSAQAHTYKNDSIAYLGQCYLRINFGNNEQSITIHSMLPRDLWQLSGLIEAAALSISPPDSWLEPAIPGTLDVVETPEGCKIVVNPTDEQPEFIGDVPAESIPEMERRRRLINASEALLDFAESVVCFPHWITSSRRSRAFELTRMVRPELPDILSETEKILCAEQHAKSEANARARS